MIEILEKAAQLKKKLVEMVSMIVPLQALGVVSAAGGHNVPPDVDTSKATDVKDTMDVLDSFLKELADSVLHTYDTDIDTASDIVFGAIDGCVESGMLDDLPEDDASPEVLHMWIDKAQKLNLSGRVSTLAFEMSDDPVEGAGTMAGLGV